MSGGKRGERIGDHEGGDKTRRAEQNDEERVDVIAAVFLCV